MRHLWLFFISLLLIGCDQFPGPNIRSEFPVHTKITISYSDRTISSHDWPPCREYFLGAYEIGRWGVKPKEGVTIDQINIEADGKVIHRFDKAAIDGFIDEAEKQPGYPVWVVDDSGFRFSTEKECALSQSQ